MRKITQIKGPFRKGSTINLAQQAGGYVHIGITKEYCQPIAPNRRLDNFSNVEYDFGSSLIDHEIDPDIQIDINNGTRGNSSSKYYINRSGILEFDVKLGVGGSIMFLKDLPAETIVDILYNTEND